MTTARHITPEHIVKLQNKIKKDNILLKNASVNRIKREFEKLARESVENGVKIGSEIERRLFRQKRVSNKG